MCTGGRLKTALMSVLPALTYGRKATAVQVPGSYSVDRDTPILKVVRRQRPGSQHNAEVRSEDRHRPTWRLLQATATRTG